MGRQPWDNYWNKFKKPGEFSFRRPEINRWALISILLTVTVAALVYFNVKTGSYIKILEKNKTELLSNLTLCYSERESLTSDLEACNSNLESKSSALMKCQGEKNELDKSLDECETDYELMRDSYNDCKDELDEFKDFLDDNNLDNIDELRDKWDDMKSDLSDCQSNLSNCQNDLDTCETDYEELLANYASDYCCLLNQTSGNITSYKIDDNRVVCTNSTNDTTLTC